MQSHHLRLALKILGYTNKSLAEEITSFRLDNQRTSEATVSRWVSGATAADPCLLMHLHERLAHHLIEHYKPRLAHPVHIAVSGGKGGSGASTKALSLAVAAKDIGYRVALLVSDKACNAGYALAQKVTDFYMAPVGNFDYEPGDYDFIFVDLPARMLIPLKPDYEEISKRLEWADLLVVPFNLISFFDREPALNAFKTLDALPSAPTWMALQCGMSLDLASFARYLKEIEPWMSLLCSRPIIYTMSPINFIHKFSATWKFAHQDAAQCFHNILEEIAERLSISLRGSMPLYGARDLSIEELVERLAPSGRKSSSVRRAYQNSDG
jgi:hypothetical protein